MAKLGRYYQVAAVLLLNTLVLFVALNLVLFVVFEIRDVYFADFYRISKWGTEHLEKIYPDLSREEINALLRETWSRPYVYEPFTQFKERPYRGAYLNVSEHGFRVTKGQGPWPPEKRYFNVFLLGGSTAFNYGVADRQTIASHLQDLFLSARLQKDVRVYNFGRAHYYSTQERLLFEKLLTAGSIPDMAVFIDGLNDFYRYKDELAFAYELQELFEMQEGALLYALRGLPLTRAIQAVQGRVQGALRRARRGEEAQAAYSNDPETIQNVVDRYIRNKKMIEAIASVFHVKAVFVWQPVPTYKYDLRYHLFAENGFGGHINSSWGYFEMEKVAKQGALGKAFLWCADIQEGVKEPLYVDRVHYTSRMSKMLAQCIVDQAKERDLLPGSG